MNMFQNSYQIQLYYFFKALQTVGLITTRDSRTVLNECSILSVILLKLK